MLEVGYPTASNVRWFQFIIASLVMLLPQWHFNWASFSLPTVSVWHYLLRQTTGGALHYRRPIFKKLDGRNRRCYELDHQ